MLIIAFLDSITAWWDSLDTAAKIFTGIGSVAGAITLVLLFLTILGLDHGGSVDAMGVDIAVDSDFHGDASLFSTRSITAFFLGFGSGGSIAYQHNGNILFACAIGAVVGTFLLFLIYWLAKKLMSMQSDGTVDFKQAVGSTGTVYITIPAKRGSGGQAQIAFNNRHEVVDAVTDADIALPSGTAIRVKECLAHNLFLVESL